IVNTIDADAPTSSVHSLPVFSGPNFTVSWAGQDGAGSGAATYDVYVSDNGGALQLWLTQTPLTQANYPGVDGHSYAFYSVATDHVGHQEVTAAAAQATTTVAHFLSADGTTLSVVRGQPLSGVTVATFTPADPNAVADDFSANIDWNDGSSPSPGTISANGDGTFSVLGDHVYVLDGSYTVQVTLRHTDGTSTSVHSSAAVTILALQADPANPAHTTL